MKSKLLFLLPILMPTMAMAESVFLPDNNPFMGTYQNQIFYGIGQGFDTGILLPPPVKPVPFYIGTITYSQPTSFFRIPARRNLNISVTLGLGEKNGWKWQDYTIPIGYSPKISPCSAINEFIWEPVPALDYRPKKTRVWAQNYFSNSKLCLVIISTENGRLNYLSNIFQTQTPPKKIILTHFMDWV